jgi:hypothetical protein
MQTQGQASMAMMDRDECDPHGHRQPGLNEQVGPGGGQRAHRLGVAGEP